MSILDRWLKPKSGELMGWICQGCGEPSRATVRVDNKYVRCWKCRYKMTMVDAILNQCAPPREPRAQTVEEMLAEIDLRVSGFERHVRQMEQKLEVVAQQTQASRERNYEMEMTLRGRLFELEKRFLGK